MRKHIPVLLQEVIKFLDPKAGKKYIDATVGEGGHAKAILTAGAKVLGVDKDPSVIPHTRSKKSSASLMRDPDLPSTAIGGLDSRFRGNDLVAVAGNFADLKRIAEENGFTEVDGILFDLGLGSHQLDDPERGFSFQKEGPLDMRYDQTPNVAETFRFPKRGSLKTSVTAADIVNHYSEKALIQTFEKYAEEYRYGKKVARAIGEQRKLAPIETTSQLFDLIKKCLPGKFRFKAGDVARRIFQALRIEVNEELKNLEKALPQALDLLERGGRLAVISFHSLEDRLVKKFFVQNAKDCICPPSFPVCRCTAKAKLRILTKKPIMAAEEEIKLNPRAHSAKLRVVQKNF